MNLTIQRAPRDTDQLWDLTRHPGQIDTEALAAAIEAAAAPGVDDDRDFRTCVLIRDSICALTDHWGWGKTLAWVAGPSNGAAIVQDCKTESERGFPSPRRRVVDTTKPEKIAEVLSEIGRVISKPTMLYVGGVAALVLNRVLARRVDAIEVVRPSPDELSGQGDWLDELERRYGLKVIQMPLNALPNGWVDRSRSIGAFGLLQCMVGLQA